jgi:hypothetical protein
VPSVVADGFLMLGAVVAALATTVLPKIIPLAMTSATKVFFISSP